MCFKLSGVEGFIDTETGRAMEAMNRLRIGIALGIKCGFREIYDCSHSDNVVPRVGDETSPKSSMPHRCASLFFARKEMVRIFQDPSAQQYYALIRNSSGKIEGRYFSEDECNSIVQELLSSRFGADPVILKNLAILQLLEEICKEDR